MNGSQLIVLVVAACNIGVMLLFPPFDAIGLGRGMQTFDAFYFVFDRQGNKIVNANLLLIQLYWVLANAAVAWLLLRRHGPDSTPGIRRTGVIAFLAINLVLIFLFPPFENYASTTRLTGTYFDGFHFIFGDKWQRRFYVPLLYMEVLWVTINAGILWLLFRDHPAPSREDDPDSDSAD